jgi:hypothetical protein
MAYMLLIVEHSGQRQARTESEGRALYDSMLRFSADLKDRGLLTMSRSICGGEGNDRWFLSAHL